LPCPMATPRLPRPSRQANPRPLQKCDMGHTIYNSAPHSHPTNGAKPSDV